MSEILRFCPRPPDWRLDWEALHCEYDWVRNLAGCMQEAVHHGEGDVWTHTRMVCEALAAMPVWRALAEEPRQVLFLAALLHDVAKPACRNEEPDGHISFAGHARRGAILGRIILWRLGVPFQMREQALALVRHHLRPFYLIDRPDSQRLALEISQTARCDWLAHLAEADARGRVCRDLNRLLDNISLFVEYCREQGCLDGPWRFPSEHSRFLYFRQDGRSADHLAYDDCRGEVVMMSGLPGAGKDTWIRQHLLDWPVVSLDQLREELDVEPSGNQGTVINHARGRARVFLRQGKSFIWNATCLSRAVRQECIRLWGAYKARIRIVYIEVSEPILALQNARRLASVPRKAIERLLSRWEIPDLSEVHQVDHVIQT